MVHAFALQSSLLSGYVGMWCLLSTLAVGITRPTSTLSGLVLCPDCICLAQQDPDALLGTDSERADQEPRGYCLGQATSS